MSLLSKIERAVTGSTAQEVEKALEDGVQAGEKSLAKTGLTGAAAEKDVLEASKSAAEASLQKLFGATVELPAKLPQYDALPAAELAAAKARSTGLTAPQACIRSPNGAAHEPVTLTVAGTLPQLEAALEKAGWVQAKPDTTANGIQSALALATSLPGISNLVQVSDAGGPMSSMLLDGKPQVVSFEKNDDAHRGRDHLRIFATGQTNAAGQPLWAIAATRDTAFKLNTATLSASHVIDHDIDGERNQVMADLLGTGQVATWTVAQGKPDAADAKTIRQSYTTDGDVFQVTLEG